jgi:hypothetical protein
MTAEFADTDELRGARFVRADLSGATFRDVDLTDAKVTDAVLVNVSLSGLIIGLTVNDVDVGPLITAELDRRHPERVLLRSTDPEDLRRGWDAIVALWEQTIVLADPLPESLRQQGVGEEWSLTETMRHLIFATDAWFGRAVQGQSAPYHPLGLVPAFFGDGSRLGLTTTATPTFDEVVSVRRDRMASVAQYLSSVTAEQLAAPRAANDDTGYPGPSKHTVIDCLHVVMDEEWNHHQYAIRDLAVLSAGASSAGIDG